jgi:ABC-type cobalamin/Fe3+-siderophores transport system ATPase subunit
MIIGVVGPCAAGKTTLIQGLKRLGYFAKHIAQEHSYVPNMWQRITHPDILIYLDVSYSLTMQRRKLDWTIAEYQKELFRLRHAREHAHLYVNTDGLSPEEVLRVVVGFVAKINGPTS